jgi:hypothetical protein
MNNLQLSKSLYDKMEKVAKSGQFSPQMVAIVACFLSVRWTTPSIVSFAVTSDGFVLAQQEGDCGENLFLSDISDFDRNWEVFLGACYLTVAERNLAQVLYENAIMDYRV